MRLIQGTLGLVAAVGAAVAVLAWAPSAATAAGGRTTHNVHPYVVTFTEGPGVNEHPLLLLKEGEVVRAEYPGGTTSTMNNKIIPFQPTNSDIWVDGHHWTIFNTNSTHGEPITEIWFQTEASDGKQYVTTRVAIDPPVTPVVGGVTVLTLNATLELQEKITNKKFQPTGWYMSVGEVTWTYSP